MNKEQVRRELLSEAVRLAETRLKSQQQFAIASDQRSLVLAGISIAAATLLIGYILPSAEKIYVLISAGLFSVSSVTAVLSARPQPMYAVGASFSSLEPLALRGESFEDVLLGLGRNLEVAAKENSKARYKAANIYNVSIGFFSLGAFFLLIALFTISTDVAIGTTP